MIDAGDPQEQVFAVLADPATHGGKPVKRIDTHAAVVFLAGERAYKVKRAVKFPFLDYSTLEKRKAACQAELDVNRPFAPDIYLGTAAVTKDAQDGLALKGDGEPVEWAVEMLRFDDSRTLDHFADAHGIDDALAGRLADNVAAMHAEARRADTGTWLESLASYLDQNQEAFAQDGDLFPPDEAAALDMASRAAFERLRPLLAERGHAGLVRRGHGDLHLGNVVVLERGPVPFDAIEFDPKIAAGDLLYDLAFLLMDLIERGLDRAANIVLNDYFARVRRPEDDEGLAALPLFLSLRAAIRAKVTAARLEHAPDEGARGKVRRSAKAYFELALRAIAPPAPRLVAVGGLSGTGKSALARVLAPHLPPIPGALVVRTDVERKAMFGAAETERLAADAYAREITAKVYERVAARAARIVAAGHSAIADAVFARTEERQALQEAAAASGVKLQGLFLIAGLETRLERVGGRARDASDADTEVARRQESYELGEIGWIEVDASGDLDTTRRRALAALEIDDTAADRQRGSGR